MVSAGCRGGEASCDWNGVEQISPVGRSDAEWIIVAASRHKTSVFSTAGAVEVRHGTAVVAFIFIITEFTSESVV